MKKIEERTTMQGMISKDAEIKFDKCRNINTATFEIVREIPLYAPKKSVTVEFSGRFAEKLAPALKKGRHIVVDGELWYDTVGIAKIVAECVSFVTYRELIDTLNDDFETMMID